MAEEPMGVTLPEDLEAKIIAMVPFPFVFKARFLSKSWLAKCSSIASEGDEGKKRLAIAFQEQVRKCSATKWKTFCPIFILKDDFMGYDRESQRWQRLPSLSFLPEEFFVRMDWCQMKGALLLVFSRPDLEGELREDGGVGRYNLYVINILTQTWKLLPPRAHVDWRRHRADKRLIHISSQKYKVVVFEDDLHEMYFWADIYDSELGTWSRSKRLDVSNTFSCVGRSNWEYLDGVFYRILSKKSCPSDDFGGLIAFNCQEMTFEAIQLPFVNVDPWMTDLAVWKASLLMLMYYDYNSVQLVIVLDIDLRSRQSVKLTQGPPPDLYVGEFHRMPAIAGDCLFFMGVEEQSGILSYNIEEDEWSCCPYPANVQPASDDVKDLFTSIKGVNKWGNFSFQPGLNPFVAL